MKRKLILYLRGDNHIICVGFEINGKQHITYDIRSMSPGYPEEVCLATSKNTCMTAGGKDQEQLVKDLKCKTVEIEAEVTDEDLSLYGINHTWVKHPDIAKYPLGI